jgi:hypothetical protein
MTEVSKNSAIENAKEALEPGEEIKACFLAMVEGMDRKELADAVRNIRAGEAREDQNITEHDRYAVMASDRNLYVFPQTGEFKRGVGGAAKILATGNFTPIDTAAGEKHALGSIEVKRDGKKRLVVGDLRLKIVRMNRKDADELLEFVEAHA